MSIDNANVWSKEDPDQQNTLELKVILDKKKQLVATFVLVAVKTNQGAISKWRK